MFNNRRVYYQIYLIKNRTAITDGITRDILFTYTDDDKLASKVLADI